MGTDTLTRRRFIQTLAAAAAGATVTLGVDIPRARGQSVRSVTFLLDVFPKGQTSPFLVALEKGFWAELGLNVTIRRGFGSADTAVRVGRGEAEFGWAGVSAVMSTVQRGLPLLEVAATAHTHPTAIYSLPDVNIREPNDLRGKRGAVNRAGEDRAVVQAFLAQVGIPYESINWLYVQGPAGLAQIIAGQADFVPTWITNLPEWWLQDPPLNPRTMWIGKALNIYGNGLITTPAFLERNRDVVRRFVLGALEGYRYVLENGDRGHEESIQILFKHNPELAVQPNAREFHLGNLKLFLSLMLDDDTREFGIGYMVPEKVERTLRFVNTYLLDEPLRLEQAFGMSPQILKPGELKLRDFDRAREALRTVLGRRNPVLAG